MISMLIGWFSMKLPLKFFFGFFVAVNLFLFIHVTICLTALILLGINYALS